MKTIADYIRTIPDFPKPGIMFRDITTILQDPDGLNLAISKLEESLEGVDYDIVVGPESRGFIFGVPVAYAQHKGFVPVRKKGKLPAETISTTYDLEYGTATIEIHKDAIRPGQKVVIVDDLIATGGSVCYCSQALEKMQKEDVIVYLKADYDTIKARLGSLKKRGVVIRKGETLKDLYDERVPLYEKYADVTIYENEFNVEKIISKITEAVNKNK